MQPPGWRRLQIIFRTQLFIGSTYSQVLLKAPCGLLWCLHAHGHALEAAAPASTLAASTAPF